MRSVLTVAIGFVLFLAHVAAAQDPYESLGMGYVVDEQDRPVAGAEVRGLWTPAEQSPFGPSLVVVRTDAEGRFQVPLPAGDVRLIELLVSDDTGLAAFKRRGISSSAAEVLEPIRIELSPCFKYCVRVLDAEGKPVAGANVSGKPDFLGKFTQQTDHLGEATVAIPIYVHRNEIVAWHDDIGIDYFRAHVKQQKDGKFDYDGHELIELELFPWTKRKIRVVDLDGQPVPDTLVWVNVIQLPRPDRWQLSLRTVCADLSNSEGFVEIPLVDDKAQHKYVFACRPGYHCFNGYSISFSSDSQVVIAKKVPITGQVTLPSGALAENIAVRIEGVCPQVREYEIDIVTDSQGRFHAEVPGQSYCRIRVLTDQYASKIHQLIVRLDEPVKPLNIALQPVTKVFGRLIDRKGMPMERESIYVRHIEEDDKDFIASLPPSERLPQPEGSRTTLRYLFNHYRTTNEKGEYELLLGPGSYHIGFGHNKGDVGQAFTITQEASLEFNFQDETRPDRVLKGLVLIAGKENAPAGGATMRGYGVALAQLGNPFGASYLAYATCDPEGRFTVTTGVRAMTLVAFSKDGKLVGVADVTKEQEEATIELFPLVKVSGQVLQSDGTPLSGSRPQLEAVSNGKERIARLVEGHRAVWSGEGKFTFNGLIPGEKYQILLKKGGKGRWLDKQLLEFTPKKGQVELNLAPFKLPEMND